MTDPDKAPGLDRIPAGLLRKCWTSSNTFQTRLLNLYGHCIRVGSIPLA